MEAIRAGPVEISVEKWWENVKKLLNLAAKGLQFLLDTDIIRPKRTIHPEIKEGERNMCQKIKELNGLTPGDLLQKTDQIGIFPVDVAQICFQMGIRLKPFDFTKIEMQVFNERGSADTGDILGAIVANGNDLAILYKKGDDVNSRRFTIAHEIAHSCLHMEPERKFHIEFRTELTDGSESEREANAFARRLLIPSDALRLAIGSSVLDTDSVNALALLFMVPEDVMRERLKELEFSVSDSGALQTFSRPANKNLLARMKMRMFS
jgi:Zn-dependent peptidase ImmA (M78 family)